MSDPRKVNAQLRELVTLMAEQATARDNLVSLQVDQLAAQKALIDSQGRLVDGLTSELEQVRGLVEALEAELARLRAQVGKDSKNSSVPAVAGLDRGQGSAEGRA